MEQQAVRLLIYQVFDFRPKADQRFQTEPSIDAHPEIDDYQVRIRRKIDGLSLAAVRFGPGAALNHKVGCRDTNRGSAHGLGFPSWQSQQLRWRGYGHLLLKGGLPPMLQMHSA